MNERANCHSRISLILFFCLLVSCNTNSGEVISGYKLQQRFSFHPPGEEIFVESDEIESNLNDKRNISQIIDLEIAKGNYYSLKYEKSKILRDDDYKSRSVDQNNTEIFWLKIQVESQKNCQWPNCKSYITKYHIIEKKFIGVLRNGRR